MSIQSPTGCPTGLLIKLSDVKFNSKNTDEAIETKIANAHPLRHFKKIYPGFLFGGAAVASAIYFRNDFRFQFSTTIGFALLALASVITCRHLMGTTQIRLRVENKFDDQQQAFVILVTPAKRFWQKESIYTTRHDNGFNSPLRNQFIQHLDEGELALLKDYNDKGAICKDDSKRPTSVLPGSQSIAELTTEMRGGLRPPSSIIPDNFVCFTVPRSSLPSTPKAPNKSKTKGTPLVGIGSPRPNSLISPGNNKQKSE